MMRCRLARFPVAFCSYRLCPCSHLRCSMRYTSCCLHQGQIQPASRAKARQGSGCLKETCSYEDQEVEQDQVHAREIRGWAGRLAYGPRCMDTIPGRPSHCSRCRHLWNLVGGWAPCNLYHLKARHALRVAKALCPKPLLRAKLRSAQYQYWYKNNDLWAATLRALLAGDGKAPGALTSASVWKTKN